MCGIVGILGNEDVSGRIFDALKRLEYRGYDSAGIATIANGVMARRRAEGKLVNLGGVLETSPLSGASGIGHTRWATHGAPTQRNAHPHIAEHAAIVHNGIIENFRELREELTEKGCDFQTETDTEVIAHLLSDRLNAGDNYRTAVAATLARLQGAFALAILFQGQDDLMYGARRGSPLVVGHGDGEMFLGSDAIALGPMTDQISYLEEGDWVEITRAGVQVFDTSGEAVERDIKQVSQIGRDLDKGNYPHFMLKEIYEQPTVVGETIGSYVDAFEQKVALPDLPFDLAEVRKITVIACGTSFYAGMVAKYWFEGIARVSVDVDIASEFRYRDAVLEEGGLAVFISQSGETADSLAALRFCKEHGQHILSIVNVTESSIARESDAILATHAGPEIGVASTKAFTCQLAVLAALVVRTALVRGAIDHAREAELCQALSEVPARMADVLHHDDAIRAISAKIAKAWTVLYLGRGADYPIALEGALKLKEISYIHAEGYAAGEMKHGPIALIDEHVPIIVIAPSGPLFEKSVSNMQEVIARQGRVIFLSDAAGIAAEGEGAIGTIEVPNVDPLVAPLLYAIPVQLLAYHAAVLRGTDVDQPRNLAKSVTVE